MKRRRSIKKGDNVKWKTLKHNGVMFPPEYKAHGVGIVYEGKKVKLNPEQEEVATMYAAIPKDGPQLGNPKLAAIFNKNFFSDFKKVLGKGSEIKEFGKINFEPIRKWVEKDRERKKERRKEEKEKMDREKEKYSIAVVDGKKQKVGNFMVEPPGLFRGRGEHPKMGRVKRRIYPEDITINIGEDSPVPKCKGGHTWGRVIHNHDVMWLASWKDTITNGVKYVWLGATSDFKGKSDMAKFEKARLLKKNIREIRERYEKNLYSRDLGKRQLATVVWVIDRLALRVGNEKDKDEADTVGSCTLRVDNIKLGEDSLELDFLGKDSIRHKQDYNLHQYGALGDQILVNLRTFMKGKKKSDNVFDKIDSGVVNEYLKELMPDLSAKVFRTMNASMTLQEQLPVYLDPELSLQEKIMIFNDANRKVAILCNHQRAVTEVAKKRLGNLGEELERMEGELGELEDMLKKRKRGKSIELRGEEGGMHMFTKQPKVEDVEKRIATWKEKIRKKRLNLQAKDENKAIALGTSKTNYIDPRITVAFAVRNDIPIDKLFTKTLREKFHWAMETEGDFEW